MNFSSSISKKQPTEFAERVDPRQNGHMAKFARGVASPPSQYSLIENGGSLVLGAFFQLALPSPSLTKPHSTLHCSGWPVGLFSVA